MLVLALGGLGVTVAIMCLGWVLSVSRRDVGVVDALWGPAVASTGVVYVLLQPQPGSRAFLAVVLACLWALRLAIHVSVRNRGKPEDRRYREIRARNEPGFTGKSFYLVFMLQAGLAWIIGLPLLGAAASTGAPGWLDAAGVLLWAAGFGFETVADLQLLRFQRERGAERAVMDRGLWRYSRHPNYFGECCLWWGIWLLALAGGAAWTVAGPALLSFLLLRVSGVALTEKDIANRRPDYQDYIRRTSAFIPLPPRSAR